MALRDCSYFRYTWCSLSNLEEDTVFVPCHLLIILLRGLPLTGAMPPEDTNTAQLATLPVYCSNKVTSKCGVARAMSHSSGYDIEHYPCPYIFLLLLLQHIISPMLKYHMSCVICKVCNIRSNTTAACNVVSCMSVASSIVDPILSAFAVGREAGRSEGRHS